MGRTTLSDPISIPREREGLLERIAERHGKRGGAWDVYVWREGEVAFLESKGPGDTLRQSQRGWLEAALAEGLDPTSFTLVEWVATV
jgi:hypothetical protein